MLLLWEVCCVVVVLGGLLLCCCCGRFFVLLLWDVCCVVVDFVKILLCCCGELFHCSAVLIVVVAVISPVYDRFKYAKCRQLPTRTRHTTHFAFSAASNDIHQLPFTGKNHHLTFMRGEHKGRKFLLSVL